MKAHGYKSKTDLQAYFTERVRQILAKNGKTMIGWDEVLQPKLAPDVVVQAWRSSKLLQRSAAAGHRTIVSAGYYLDYDLSASYHYGVDPYDTRAAGLPAEAVKAVKGTPFEDYITDVNVAFDSPLLTPEQEKLVDGAIACMWTEFVWNEREEMEVWPRTAAIAERLWSPASVKDVGSMYYRLAGVDSDLELIGLRHHSSEMWMLQRLAGAHSPAPLATLAETVEPIKNLARYGPDQSQPCLWKRREQYVDYHSHGRRCPAGKPGGATLPGIGAPHARGRGQFRNIAAGGTRKTGALARQR